MKQDMELIKLMLQTLANEGCFFMGLEEFAIKIQQETNQRMPYTNEFIGHFFLAKDSKLIEEMSVCFFVGQGYNYPAPANGGKVRITAQGLEFLEALKNDTVFHKVKDLSLGVAADVGKSLLTTLISKTLGID